MSHIAKNLLYDSHHKQEICELLETYGVDIDKDTTLLGFGSYKEVHSTNVDDVVMIITNNVLQFNVELEALEALASINIPVMKIYSHQKIDGVFALAQKCYFPKHNKELICEKVRSFLHTMVENDLIPQDLQFLVDKNNEPIFHDPFLIDTLSGYKDRYGKYCKYFALYAFCKGNNLDYRPNITINFYVGTI